LILFFFFFSSRRRHTRSDRDWSSDVCSSDLDIRRTSVRLFYSSTEPAVFTSPVGRLTMRDERERIAEDIIASGGNGLLPEPDARSEERRVGKECRSGVAGAQ